MAVISFLKNNKTIHVTEGSNLMQELIKADIPVASSCYGDGVCAKCKLQIIKGNENLSKPNATELFLMDAHSLKKDERISCQTHVLGDVCIWASYW